VNLLVVHTKDIAHFAEKQKGIQLMTAKNKKKAPKPKAKKPTKDKPNRQEMLEKISVYLMEQFVGTTQLAKYTKEQKKLAAISFCCGINTLPPVISIGLSEAEWVELFDLFNAQLEDYDF